MRDELRADVFSLIEEFITRARPDIAECLDCILPPMLRALETRYSDADLQDVRIDYKALRESLEELARSIPTSLEDDAYEAHIARETH